ncbi:MAG TPA: hypothetical protein VFI54_05605 [Solirubrobacteraceae bacterium]|nr:hypothetical protein [Solirubrobacteraceae bacterium]
MAVLALCPSAGFAAGGPIMPLSEVQAGMDCTADTVIQGTTISSFDVHVLGVVQDPQIGPRILIRASGPAVEGTGIAEGFSGSPVYCPDALGEMRNAGAISEGVGDYGNNDALVTPIEQMLGEPVTPPSSAPRLEARVRPLLGPLMIGGLSPSLLHLVQKAGQLAGRTILAAPAGAAASFPIQSLVPGASVAVSYSDGAIPMGGIGTVTYRDGNNVYAFGHELDGAGRRSLLLQDAYVYSVIGNPLGLSYKLAAPGHTVGTLTSDTPNAVVGEVGPAPTLVPVQVTARDLDTGHEISLVSDVADETAIGLPLGTSLVDVIAPVQAGQAATAIYDGPPANESGRMCVTVGLRESRLPLRFCNRYVGTGFPGDEGLLPPELAAGVTSDLSSAFQLLEGVQFATLHVTKVDAQIEAQRGLDEASIVSARAPKHARRGQRITVHLVVRVFRGKRETLSFPLRVPRHPRHHRLLVSLRGPSESGLGVDDLLSALAGALGGSGGPPLPGMGPSSIAQLRHKFAAIATYDGIDAKFNGRTKRVYRNGSLLITGNTALSIRISG